jgi:hypothetical protein
MIKGGRNIAMKVPTHQFEATVEAYRALGLPVLHEGDALVTFEYGTIRLHIDCCQAFSQAELWLEFITDDLPGSERTMDDAGFDRRDEIENLAGHRGFWASNPVSIVHLVSDNE